MGCLKLTYYLDREPKINTLSEELTTKISSQTACSSYLFGFNGQEKDDEVAGAGNINTAMFWEYDTRLGRRWNLDPKNGSFPDLSPYSVFIGNPIIYNDKNGDVGHLVIVDDAKGGGGTVFVVATYYTVKGGVAKNGFDASQMNDIKGIEANLNANNYTISEKIEYEGKDLKGYKVQFLLKIVEVDSPEKLDGNNSTAIGIQTSATTSAVVTADNSITNYSPKEFAKLPNVGKIAKSLGGTPKDMGAITDSEEKRIAKQDGVNAYVKNGATFATNILHEMFHTWGVDKDKAPLSENSIGTGSMPNQDDIHQVVKSLINSKNVSKSLSKPQ